MLLIIYEKWFDGFNLIILANKFSDGNNGKKLVFGTPKIQGYA